LEHIPTARQQHEDAAQSDLAREAIAIRELGASIISSTDIRVYAVEAAIRHWRVFPLRGKVPAVRNPHPEGSDQRRDCRGECGLDGHGVYDASDDLDKVIRWWTGQHRGANIGVRIPQGCFLLDVDPREGGDEKLAKLIAEHGPLPDTLQQFSGRGDGGTHLLFRRPPGQLRNRIDRGLDVKASSGYMVWAPSVHPDSGKQYRRIDRPVAIPPSWLVDMIVVPVQTPATRLPRAASTRVFAGPSVADQFCAATTWEDILAPRGWTCPSGNGDDDGAVWLRTRTSKRSATVRNNCLFVYTTSSVFDTTSAGDRHGYTKFRAYAVLEYGGDMKAAARALSTKGAA
jgi:hypothetical protein